ncbi:MAG: hypothetical protein ACOYLN_01270 [Blastocatellia bacterium]
MIPELRDRFNANFTDDTYRRFVRAMEAEVGTPIEFRPCETPVFLPKSLVDELLAASRQIVSQLDTPEYLAISRRSIPVEFDVPNEGRHPLFVQVDFALVDDGTGRIVPRLIELQGCPSLYAYQAILPHFYRRYFNLDGPEVLDHLLDGLSEDEFLRRFSETVLNGHDPREVVLMEIEPLRQKTLPDFRATEKLIGVSPVCITDLIRRGRKLFYRRDGQEVEIRRLYNRVIIDELVRRAIHPPFDLREDLDVEWAGHPNWYFRWSKFALPYLRHPTVPRSWFLDQLPEVPADPENFVLKPLFSFAGAGVRVRITAEDIERIPEEERSGYLLQERVEYAPVVRTPDGPSRVEVRIMFLWPEGSAPIPVTTLTRLSKGLMMGVDFNQNQTWVGSSCAFFPKQDG